jgi:hypothetical protein
MKRFLVFLLPFAFCLLPLCASAQDEGPPALSLSTSEVFTTRDAPNFYLTFRRIAQLDFRVYKVRDPFVFEGLNDPHSLGTGDANVKQERTWLERFADWKRLQRLFAVGVALVAYEASRLPVSPSDPGTVTAAVA